MRLGSLVGIREGGLARLVRQKYSHVGAPIVALWGLLLYSTHAVAQTYVPPPIHSTVDANGVDLISGTFNIPGQAISVGVPGQGGMTWRVTSGYVSNTRIVGDNFTGQVNYSGGCTTLSIDLFGQRHTFQYSGGTFYSQQGDGTTLSYSGSCSSSITSFGMSLPGGTQATFSLTWGDGTVYARVTSVTFSTGETYAYSYHSYDACYPMGCKTVLLDSVSNNLGYQIHYVYQYSSQNIGGIIYMYSSLSQILAINGAVDYCSPYGGPCSGLTVTWPAVTISGTNGNVVTDNLGRQTSYPLLQASSTSTLVSPSGQTTTIVTDASRRVTSIGNGVGTWTYSYADNGTQRTTTVTDPLGHGRVVVSDTTLQRPLSDTDALNHATTFTYDTYGRLSRATHQEGDYSAYTYDTRGNVTQTQMVGKDQVSTITYTAGFDTTCTYPAKCNQPNWTKDARGNQTDYTYNTTTGQITQVIPPVGANGLRPETDYTYTNLYAWYKNSSGVIVQAATPVSMLTQVSKCRNAQTCAGSADAVRSVFTYGTSGVANNLLLTSTTSGAGDGSLAATSSVTYDGVGNVYTQTDPVGNVTRLRFDTARQLVGVVSPDPDGGGVLNNRAVRLTYRCDATVKAGCDGLVTLAEQGTVASQSDASWAGFATLAQASTTYDTIDRKTVEALMNGSTYIGVSQYSYDTANRVSCVATRMNAAAMGSLPTSACTLGTQGSAGPDRITVFTYDNVNRLLKSTSGYGTTVQADNIVNTYGANNEVATVADGKGNLTTYDRDTFNRVYKVRYPTPGNGSVSSTTDYEQYTYDSDSNVTQVRRRDGTVISTPVDALNLVASGYNGITFGYDNLGRMTSASVGGQSQTMVYNGLSQLTSQTGPLGTVGNAFDVAGRQTRLTYPDGYYVSYSYDTTNELTSIVDSSSVTLMSMAYDNLGRVASVSRALGASQTLSYGSDLHLSALSYAFGDTSKNVTFNYTYNLAGQPLTMTTSNALYRSTMSRSATNYTSDGQNKYQTVGGNSISYDGQGNLSNGGVTSFGYDGIGRMTSAAGATLHYDANGNLDSLASGATTTKFLYAGAQMIAEYDGGGTLLRRYVPGPGLDQPLVWFEGAGTASSTARWLLANGMGSIVAVGSSGSPSTTIGINVYDEYGQNGASNVGRFQYKGMPWIPEIGLYHSRARAYSPALGRFMQPDPAGYGDGMNRYTFVHNTPLASNDPMGLGDANNCNFNTPNGNTSGFGPNACDVRPPVDPDIPEEVVVTGQYPDFRNWTSPVLNIGPMIQLIPANPIAAALAGGGSGVNAGQTRQGNQDKTASCPNTGRGGPRLPDFVSLSVSLPIPTPWTALFLGVGVSFAADRYGHFYFSLNGVAGGPTAAGASLMGGWVNSSTMPSESQLSGVLSQWGAGVSGGYIGGAGFSGNSSGTATHVGLTTPGASGYGGYTWKTSVQTPVWCH